MVGWLQPPVRLRRGHPCIEQPAQINLNDEWLGGTSQSETAARQNARARPGKNPTPNQVFDFHGTVIYSTLASPLPLTTSPMIHALCFCA